MCVYFFCKLNWSLSDLLIFLLTQSVMLATQVVFPLLGHTLLSSLEWQSKQNSWNVRDGASRICASLASWLVISRLNCKKWNWTTRPRRRRRTRRPWARRRRASNGSSLLRFISLDRDIVLLYRTSLFARRRCPPALHILGLNKKCPTK